MLSPTGSSATSSWCPENAVDTNSRNDVVIVAVAPASSSRDTARSVDQLLEVARGARDQPALDEGDSGVADRGALGLGLDALGDDGGAELAGERGHRADDATLGGVALDVADQRHVELDDLGLERGERGEAGVAGAEIVDGDAEAEA